jgi:CubicO group peptidase (beta-lactamase class C family)
MLLRAGVRPLGRRLATTSAFPPPTTTVVEDSGSGPGPFGSSGGGTVSGSVKGGWEDLRAAFENNFGHNKEVCAQLAVYQEGELVVDLHGSSTSAASLGYTGDTLQNIFSSGKNFEAVAIMMLVDRGVLQYEDKIADHWPAFAQHGKGDITVENLMRHESGLQFFADPEHPDDMSKTRVPTVAEVAETASGAVERLIEGSAAWGHGKRMYHASTRGFVVNGLVRQATGGTTLGAFVRDEIAGPLGITAYCGASLEEQAAHHYVEMQKCGVGYTLTKEVLPALVGSGGNPETLSTFKTILGAAFDRKHPLRGYAKAMPAEWMEKGGDHDYPSTPEGRTLEVSSGGVQANARSLAKVAGLMANGGELGGVRLASRDAVAHAMGGAKVARDDCWRMTMANSRGGFFDFGSITEMGGWAMPPAQAAAQAGFVGWAGKGGSLFLWHPAKRIGFAYTMSGMMNGGTGGPRTAPFFEVLCAK